MRILWLLAVKTRLWLWMKYVERRTTGLPRCTIAQFVKRRWRHHKEPQDLRSRFEFGTSRIRSMSTNRWTTTSGVMMNTQLPKLNAIGPRPDHNHLSYSSNIHLNRVVSKSFRTESITKCTLTFCITRWEATRRVVAAKLTRLTHKIAIQLHLLAESYHM
jgi:hypothetical protein